MSPRPVAGAELQRILAIVPWIIAHPGTDKAEIAQRFGMGVDELDDDLALVMMIGVPPYSPGDYLDVEEDDDGRVTIRLADWFKRPLRLTPAEGLSLLAAGRTLLAVPGSEDGGPLATALAKLEHALGAPGLAVDVGATTFLDDVRDAAARCERVEIDYWSAGRNEVTRRVVEPTVVFFALGAWYVGAHCLRADAERMFRVDRIRALRPTGERFAPRESGFEAGDVFTPRAGDPRVTLRLTRGAAWVAEAYPTEAVTERPDGGLDVVLAVSETGWLERLLLRLGPDAKVLAPAEWRTLGADAARRVLSRYESVPPDGAAQDGDVPADREAGRPDGGRDGAPRGA